jgi:hypothetical protein
MRQLITTLCVSFLIALSHLTHAQELEKNRYVVVPREEALISVAVQPDCPIKFENVRLLARVGGGGGVDFRMRNVGDKPVRSISYAHWNTFGNGGWSAWPGEITHELVKPGQLVPLSAGDSPSEIIPLTKALRSKMKLGGSMKAVIVLMIRRVEYADGTVYEDQAQSEGLRALMEKVGKRVDW